MKKPLRTIGAGAAGVIALVGVGVLAWKFFTISDPYLVKPLRSSPAPVAAMTGYSVASGSRTLSVISSNDIVVVADPGASSTYEVVWLVQQPRKDGTHALMEFKCELPPNAAVDRIEPLGSPIPPKIQKVANGRLW